MKPFETLEELTGDSEVVWFPYGAADYLRVGVVEKINEDNYLIYAPGEGKTLVTHKKNLFIMEQ